MPLVPDSVDDCCSRLIDATDVSSRVRAREYVTFLRALELVEETPRGYRRRDVEPDRADLADAFERRVFGVRELLDALETAADDALTADEAFEELRHAVPRWERERHGGWEREWRDRTERLLEWGVVFDLVERTGEGYRATDRS